MSTSTPVEEGGGGGGNPGNKGGEGILATSLRGGSLSS